MFNGDQARSGAGPPRGSRLRLLAAGVPARPRRGLQRMAPPASRAAQGGAEPKVGHLPGREPAVRTHEGRAQVSGTLPDWRGEEEVASGFRPASSQQGGGVDRTLQVCRESTVTQPTAAPPSAPRWFPPLGLKPGSKARWAGPAPPLPVSRSRGRARGAAARRAAGRAPSGPDSGQRRSGPGSSGRSRSSSAQRALPPGPASRVPSSCSCSSSCSSPPRDSSASLPPAKSPARWQPSRRHRRVSGCPRPFPPAVPGCSEARSAGRRCSTALPMAQPESRLRAPDRLERCAAQVSEELAQLRPPAGEWQAVGRSRCPDLASRLRASTGPKVRRGWGQCSGCRGARREALGLFCPPRLLP